MLKCCLLYCLKDGRPKLGSDIRADGSKAKLAGYARKETKMNFEMIITLFLTAVAMAMDAFAVAICKGLSIGNVKLKHAAITGAWFGGFQAAMPLIGYLVGSLFAKYIEKFDHWVAFILLLLIGANMIKESFSKEESSADASLGFTVMLTMAIATSIDALAIGISYAMSSDVNIWLAITFIGVITFALSALGVKIGSIFGTRYKCRAELAGGIVLILIGTYNLLEDLGVFAFG